MTLLAQISGSAALNSLFLTFLIVLCALIVWWLGNYFFPKFGAPAIVLQVWTGLFILLGAIVLINFLLSLAGRPFIKW